MKKYLRWFRYVILLCLTALLIWEIVDRAKLINICIQNNLVDAIRELYGPIIVSDSVALLFLIVVIIFTIAKHTKFNGLIMFLTVLIVMGATIKPVYAGLSLKNAGYHYQDLYNHYKYLIGFPVCIGTYFLYALVEVFIQFIYPKIKQSKAVE